MRETAHNHEYFIRMPFFIRKLFTCCCRSMPEKSAHTWCRCYYTSMQAQKKPSHASRLE
jgi:hypothetical protein